MTYSAWTTAAGAARTPTQTASLSRRTRPGGDGSMLRRTSGGFTLTELMIALVIAAIIAAVALPAYQDHARKARRAEGHAALIDAASRQEEFFLNNKTYTATVGAGGLNALPTTENGYYAITVDAPTAACPIDRCYQLRATPQGNQATDSCGALTLDFDRVKAPSNCW